MASHASSEVVVPLVGFYTEISTEVVWDRGTEAPENITIFGNESYFSTNDTDVEVDLPIVICSSIVLIFINLTVVIGNILVLLAVYCERALRTATNYFIFNLALADLLLGTLVLPFSGTYEVMRIWPFGHVFCDVWAAVDVLCCTASINSLCCISIDRYIGVTKPLQHRLIMTPKRAVLICIFVWFLSFLIAVGPLFGWRPPKIKPLDCPLSDSLDYVMFSVSGSFYIPLVIIIVLYIKIYCEVVARDTSHIGVVRKSSIQKGRRKNNHAGIQLRVHVGSQRSYASGSRSSNRRDVRYRPTSATQRALNFNREKKVAKTLGIVVGVFILCWFPFFFLLPLTSACPIACEVPAIVFKVVFWLGYCNSFVNPLIYALSNHTFRRAFRKILTCRYWLRRRRRRFHARRWSNISRYTDSTKLSSPIVSSCRYSKRNKAPSVTPEATPMLPDSASPFSAHTSTSALLSKHQNGSVIEFKPVSTETIREVVLPNTENKYVSNNCVRLKIIEIATVEECERMLNRTHSLTSSSSSSSSASSSSQSSENKVQNVTTGTTIPNSPTRTSMPICNCKGSRQNGYRRSSSFSKASTTQKLSGAFIEGRLRTSSMTFSSSYRQKTANGAFIRNSTPPDLVADIFDPISDSSDNKRVDKAITGNVFRVLAKHDINDSKETPV